MVPSLDYENRFWQAGYRYVAGLDEVGRGCLAGPVVAGAVVLPSNDRALCTLLRAAGVRDSKKLTPAQREALLPLIEELALAATVGVATAAEIDEHGIVPACRQAMARAVEALPVAAEALLVDAFPLPGETRPQEAIVKGDDLSLSIAAAAIVAKVHRDRLMVVYDGQYPGYGFASHKGYAVRSHLRALQEHGASPIHRMSWKPLRELSIRQMALEMEDGEES